MAAVGSLAAADSAAPVVSHVRRSTQFSGYPQFWRRGFQSSFRRGWTLGSGVIAAIQFEHNSVPFIDRRERWPYLIVFAGLLLTAFGSSYYHLRPGNARLVWDRLPMTIVFMSLVSAIIAERISPRTGLWLLPVLLVIGLRQRVAVAPERTPRRRRFAILLRGAGVFHSISVDRTSPPVELHARLRPGDCGGFLCARQSPEILDRPIFELGHLVSGHTLKHLAAAAAGYWILRML